jgi:hypothetical protein
MVLPSSCLLSSSKNVSYYAVCCTSPSCFAMQKTQHFNVPHVDEYKNEKDHHQQLLQSHENKNFMKKKKKKP